MTFTRVRVSCALVATFLATGTHAATLVDFQPDLTVDNGDCRYYDNCAGGSNPNVFGAENFTLSSDNTITAVSFYAIVQLGNPDALGSVDWLLLEDDGFGAPGSIVAQGAAFGYTSQFFGTGTGPNEFLNYRYDVDVTDTFLAAGDYWLAVNLNGGPNFNEFAWSITSVGALNSATNVRGDPTGGWTSPYGGGTEGNKQEFAFRINVVPVPAAAWLFGSALGLLGWLKRRS